MSTTTVVLQPIRISEKLHEDISRIARTNRRSRAEEVRIAIEERVEKEKAKREQAE